MMDDDKIKKKIIEELRKHFQGNADFVQLRDDETFWYSRKVNDKWPSFEVKFTHSGLKIDWEGEQEINLLSKLMPPPDDGEAHLTMDGETPPKKPDE